MCQSWCVCLRVKHVTAGYSIDTKWHLTLTQTTFRKINQTGNNNDLKWNNELMNKQKLKLIWFKDNW